MATFTGNLAPLLAPGLAALLMDTLEKHEEEFSQFTTVSTMERPWEDEQEMTGFGKGRLKLQGAPVTFDDPKMAGSKRYEPNVYALAWQVSEEMMDDDQYGKIRQLPSMLADGLMESLEDEAINLLNLGHSTSVTSDGLSTFNTAHPLQDGAGTTLSNTLSPAAAMTATAIENIILLFEDMKNNRNLPRALRPTDIWFGPALQFKYQRIFQSQFEPGTGNNDINAIQGRLDGHVLHRLTSQTAFYVSSKGSNGMKTKWRKRPRLDAHDDFKTKSSEYSVHGRWAVGTTFWRGWASSNAT